MGKFVVESDEPLARGGTEKGPSPLQYVMMGTEKYDVDDAPPISKR